MKTCHIISMIAVLSVVMSSAVLATTGQIHGIVTNVDGIPMADVAITVSSPSMQGMRQSITTDSGGYRFFGLPPGVYELRFEHDAIRTLVRRNVHVFLGCTTTASPVLQSGSPDDVLYLTRPTGLLDMKNSSSSIVVEADFADRLPGTKRHLLIPEMSPFVTETSQAHAGGGTLTDNVWSIDGFNTTDSVTSTFGMPVPPDAIEQVSAQTGGFKAEHGHALGGIFQTITRSGSNRFHGSFRWKRVDTDNRSQDKQEAYRRLPDWEYDEYDLTFSGPIMRDKLWFMLAYHQYTRDSENQLDNSAYGDSTPVDVDSGRISDIPFFKLTFQPLDDHTFVFTGINSSDELKNWYWSWNYTPEALGSVEQSGTLYGLEWTWRKDTNLMFVTRVGHHEFTIKEFPTDGDRNSPAFYDRHYALAYNNYGRWIEDTRNRFQLNSSVSYFIDNLMGAHVWKAGFE